MATYNLEVSMTPPSGATEVIVSATNLTYGGGFSGDQWKELTANSGNSWTVNFLGFDQTSGDPGVMLTFIPFDGADYMEPAVFGPYDLTVYGDVPSGP